MPCSRLILLLLLVPATRGNAQMIVRGRLTDDMSLLPIGTALVTLLDQSRGGRRATVAEEDGSFEFRDVAGGTYRLHTEPIGYTSYMTAVFTVAGTDTVVMELKLKANPIALDPLDAVGRAARPSARLDGFYQRKETSVGNGTFITREDVDRRKPGRVTDLLGGVPGIQVVSGNRVVNRTANCEPEVFVDGVRRTDFRAGRGARTAVDQLNAVRPADVEGIEIYRRLTQLPAEFAAPTGSSRRCGVIAVWTRVGR